MKNSFKKTHAIILLLATMSVALVGCGTDADSGGMSGQSTTTLIK